MIINRSVEFSQKKEKQKTEILFGENKKV
jgi:hypothetical protein